MLICCLFVCVWLLFDLLAFVFLRLVLFVVSATCFDCFWVCGYSFVFVVCFVLVFWFSDLLCRFGFCILVFACALLGYLLVVLFWF